MPGNYNIDDLLDHTFTIKKNLVVYDLPDLNSSQVGTLQTGDSILIFSFQNVNGRTWLGFHLNQIDYDNFDSSYIPLTGAPMGEYSIPQATLNSAVVNPTILTQEQQEAAANPNSIFDDVGGLITKFGVIAGGLMLLSNFSNKPKKNDQK